MTSVKKEVQLDTTALMGYLVACQTEIAKMQETVVLLTLPGRVKDWFEEELEAIRDMVTHAQAMLY